MQQGGKEWGRGKEKERKNYMACMGNTAFFFFLSLFFGPRKYPIGQIPLSEAEPLFARASLPCQALFTRVG